MKIKFLTFISCFFLLFMVFFPVVLDSWKLQKTITLFVFSGVAEFIGKVFSSKNYLIDFSSDSFSLYILMLILAIITIIISIFIKKRQNFINFTNKIIPYYIAIILLKYGADKLFKGQFYQPEPNILFTKFGNLDQDILYWSVMGTSRTYSLILGLIEICIAVLLMFRKTQILGLVLAIFTFANIIIINFSFDISVKLFSITLLLMCIFALGNFWKIFYNFIINGQSSQLQSSDFYLNRKFQNIILPLKILIFGLVFLQIFLPFYLSKNWNDDQAERPFLHGAYQVFSQNSIKKTNIKYVFFHRNQYLIFMNNDDQTLDFRYSIDKENQKIKYTNYNGKSQIFHFEIQEQDSLMILKNKNETLQLKYINWKKMPALQSQFHWIVDELRQ